MRLYARSDVTAVNISSDLGGCGLLHSRPVVKGAPSKIFPLDCPQCTVVLRHDPLWSDSQLKIPLTPDEERVSEEMEKQGDMVMHQVSAALAKSSIEQLRTAQSEDLRSWQQSQERQAADERYNALSQELEQLKALLATQVVQNQAAPESATIDQGKASGASAVRTTHARTASRKAAPGACSECGGPLRVKGQRGPTPKGTCMNCRKARAA